MAMARIVLGNRDGALALRGARGVLEQLSDEWPDLNFALRTVHDSRDGADDTLISALREGAVGVAVVQLETLPLTLPEGIALAAVGRRLEPRCALVARGVGGLDALPAAARVGVPGERDATFLRARGGDLSVSHLSGKLDEDLALLASGELDAIVLPAATLVALDRRNRIGAVLEPEVLAPAPGQGALGLLVRDDDDLAFETAYSLQHRPSFDRVRAERSFAAALAGAADRSAAAPAVGALATVTVDGELTLFGAVARDASTLQASISGDAREADELGRELAQDVLERWAAL